ncbi:hypothetical protein D9981_04035 [Pseudoalteromonas phenolica O-BC30]|nr:hypothetical protein D9981_04035 [Pseudoalteromonas phenolica O-BC30]TMO54139.1 hypothetical protein CWC21_16320 [Pseudoalteromonas phenolica]
MNPTLLTVDYELWNNSKACKYSVINNALQNNLKTIQKNEMVVLWLIIYQFLNPYQKPKAKPMLIST